MAPKRPTYVNDAPASLEEEETASGSEEEEGESSSEDDHTQKLPRRSSLPPPKPDSLDESESDSGTESDSESDLHPVPRKPIADTKSTKHSKPTSTKKTKSKPKSSAVVKASSKRGTEVEKDEKGSKRPKTKDSDNGAEAEETKKQLFQRIWSEDDEVALLKGIIAFTDEKGIDCVKDMNPFHDFIKTSLHFDVSLSQLRDKVWKLKRKFENHVRKGNKTFSKQHDQRLFNLSKKIWGSESKSKTELGEKVVTEVGWWSFDKGVRMEEYVMERGLAHLADEGKKSEMEEKWRKLHVAELELFVKRKEVIAEQGKLLLASLKRSL